MGRLEFEKTVQQFGALGNNARATLMFRMIQVMGPALLRTVIKYCHKRLDEINGKEPSKATTFKQVAVYKGRPNFGYDPYSPMPMQGEPISDHIDYVQKIMDKW